MSLKSYCEENNRLRILNEWDTEKNFPITPDSVAHTSRTCADAVISGRDDGTLDPQGLAKRCEAAQMVMRFCEEYSK